MHAWGLGDKGEWLKGPVKVFGLGNSWINGIGFRLNGR